MAAISQATRSSPAQVIGTCQALSSPKRRISHSNATDNGASTVWNPNTAVAVCSVRSGRRTSLSSTAYHASVNSVLIRSGASQPPLIAGGSSFNGGSAKFTSRFTAT